MIHVEYIKWRRLLLLTRITQINGFLAQLNFLSMSYEFIINRVWGILILCAYVQILSEFRRYWRENNHLKFPIFVIKGARCNQNYFKTKNPDGHCEILFSFLRSRYSSRFKKESFNDLWAHSKISKHNNVQDDNLRPILTKVKPNFKCFSYHFLLHFKVLSIMRP